MLRQNNPELLVLNDITYLHAIKVKRGFAGFNYFTPSLRTYFTRSNIAALLFFL